MASGGSKIGIFDQVLGLAAALVAIAALVRIIMLVQ
jgi:hypothetical protein